jgi:hypothetical protein
MSYVRLAGLSPKGGAAAVSPWLRYQEPKREANVSNRLVGIAREIDRVADELFVLEGQAMSTHDRSHLDHRVSWPAIWAGLALAVIVGGAAVSAAVLSPDGSTGTADADPHAGNPTFPLRGVQDPGQRRWRSANKAWNPPAWHELEPEQDDEFGAGGSGNR